MSPNLYNAFDRPLRIELAPSRLLTGAWLTLYALAACGLYSLSLEWPLRMGLLGILTVYAWLAYRLHIKVNLPYSVCALAWDVQQGWQVRQRGNGWQPAELCMPVLVHYRIAALRVRLRRWRTISVVVVADRAGADDFRRLRVRLLQSAHGNRDRTKISGAR
jgi:hypothetical protein